MQKCLVIFFPVVKMICFYYQTCLVRLHSYFFNATQGLVMYVLRILWGKKRAISPFLQNSCIMGFALHKCRGRTGRTRVPKGHTACWVMHRIKYILSTLLYGYSLIIAKNFVTVYTAFDYWDWDWDSTIEIIGNNFKGQNFFNLNSRLPLFLGSITSSKYLL